MDYASTFPSLLKNQNSKNVKQIQMTLPISPTKDSYGELAMYSNPSFDNASGDIPFAVHPSWDPLTPPLQVHDPIAHTLASHPADYSIGLSEANEIAGEMGQDQDLSSLILASVNNHNHANPNGHPLGNPYVSYGNLPMPGHYQDIDQTTASATSQDNFVFAPSTSLKRPYDAYDMQDVGHDEASDLYRLSSGAVRHPKRKPRNAFNYDQRDFLLAFFNYVSSRPSRPQREFLVQHVGTDEKTIRIWFQNYRQKVVKLGRKDQLSEDLPIKPESIKLLLENTSKFNLHLNPADLAQEISRLANTASSKSEHAGMGAASSSKLLHTPSNRSKLNQCQTMSSIPSNEMPAVKHSTSSSASPKHHPYRIPVPHKLSPQQQPVGIIPSQMSLTGTQQSEIASNLTAAVPGFKWDGVLYNQTKADSKPAVYSSSSDMTAFHGCALTQDDSSSYLVQFETPENVELLDNLDNLFEQ